MQPQSFDGCSWYRINQIVEEVRNTSDISVHYINLQLPEDVLGQVLEEADVYFFRLNSSTRKMFEIIKNLGKKVILDIDDNYEIIEPLSNMYAVYGLKEVKLPNGKMLYEDGKKGFSIEKNTKLLEDFKYIMRNVSVITVTTNKLKDYAKQYNKNVAVIPNAIDFTKWKQIEKQDKVNIVYAGGSSHFPDLVDVKDVFVDIVKTYPHVHFHFLGQVFGTIVKDMPKDRYTAYGWISADGHSYRMSLLQGDIGLAPLRDVEFNYYKSSVKFYEYSASGMATIARNILPYKEDIIHGKTGLLYDSIDEFRSNLKLLIEDPILRKDIANNAYQYVKTFRSIKDITITWLELLHALCQK